MAKKQLDALICAGWDALEHSSEREDLEKWREQARQCVTQLAGDDHPYAEHFKHGMLSGGSSGLLTDVGVLSAAKLWLFQGLESCDTTSPGDTTRSEPSAAVVKPVGPFCYLKLTNCASDGSAKCIKTLKVSNNV